MNEIMKDFKVVYDKIDLMNEIMEFGAVYNKMIQIQFVVVMYVVKKREKEREIANEKEEQMRRNRVSDFFYFLKKNKFKLIVK